MIPSFVRVTAIEPDEITHRLAFARVLVDRRDVAVAHSQLEVAVTLRARGSLDQQDLEAAQAQTAPAEP